MTKEEILNKIEEWIDEELKSASMYGELAKSVFDIISKKEETVCLPEHWNALLQKLAEMPLDEHKHARCLLRLKCILENI